MSRNVDELLAVVLKPGNDALRDDAAEELAKCTDSEAAQAALVRAIGSPDVDDSLRRTCAESLAEIWIARRKVDQEIFRRLNGMPREVVVAFLKATGLGDED
jgi:hypothetical protein